MLEIEDQGALLGLPVIGMPDVRRMLGGLASCLPDLITGLRVR